MGQNAYGVVRFPQLRVWWYAVDTKAAKFNMRTQTASAASRLGPHSLTPLAAADDGISQLLARLYEVISFPEGGEPDWAGMEDVFSPHARITRVTPEGTDYFDLPTFQAMARELVRVGAYTAFHEREVGRRVERFGNVAHVKSAYETRGDPEARACLGRGVNSLQLVLESEGWRVLSLCWDEEALKDQDVRALVEDGRHG